MALSNYLLLLKLWLLVPNGLRSRSMALGRMARNCPSGKRLRRGKLPEMCADRAREQSAATIVHSERMSAGAPQRPVHALLARLIADTV